MSYLDHFQRYGQPSDSAEITLRHYLRRPDKITTAEYIAYYDHSAASLIAECNALIAFAKEYRQALAARYGELETMPYRDVLKLAREPRADGIHYYVTITRQFEDGSEQGQLSEHYTGKDRRAALARFAELQKSRPGIETVKDIEKRPWEK